MRSHALELVDGSRDDRERGEQLVGDIGEYHAHLQAVAGLQAIFVPAQGGKQSHDEHQDIDHACPS